MAYTIKRTNGSTITIEDNALDTTYGVQLIGKNRLGFGTSFNQNFFRLMENFSNSSSPSNPVSGQLWWDTAGFLKVYTGSTWKQVSSALVSEPAAPVNGDLWLDTVNAQLKAYNGTTGTWITVGPSNATTGVQNGFVTEAITQGASDVYVATMYVDGTRVAILSRQNLTGTAYSGFTDPRIGLNFNTNLNCGIYNANISGTTGVFSGNVTVGNINNVSGILSVTGNATLGNIISAGSAAISGGIASTSTTTGTMRITGGAGITGNLNVGGNASAGNISITGAASVTGNVIVGANLTVTGNAELGGNANVKITGGTSGQLLSTDGSGNLTWISPTSGTINIGTVNRLAYYTGATNLSATSSSLSWNDATNTLALTGNLQATNVTISGNLTVDTNTFYIDANNNRVGVGTTTPSHRVHIYQADTDSLNNTNFRNEYIVAPTVVAGQTYIGGNLETRYTASVNGSNITVVGSQSRALASGSGNVQNLESLRLLTTSDNSGNVTTSYGANIGLSLTNTGNVQSHYGVYVRNPVRTGAGNVTNNYGLFVENQTTGTANNYAVYSAGGTNYFGGNVLVGTLTTPSANLTVNGTTNLGPISNVTITGGSANQVLTTNGSGVLSWVTPGTINSGTAGRIAFYATSGTVLSETNSALAWNNSSNVLTVGGNVSTSNLTVTSTGNIQTLEVPASGSANIKSTTTSTTSTTGALVVAGGAGIGGNIYVGTNANIAGTANVVGNLSVGNVTTAGNATVGNLSATANISAGNASVTSNISAGNITTTANVSAGNVTATANISAGNASVTSNISAGNITTTANVSAGNVTATANVAAANLRASATLNVTGNANVGNLGTAGNITASYFFGNGSQLTGIAIGPPTSIVNGTSNVVAASSGNVTTSVAGTADVLVVTSTGANIAGTANITGNLYARRIGNIAGGAVFTLPDTDGSAGQVLITNGLGVLSWTNNGAGAIPTQVANGTSNVIVVLNGNIALSASATSNVVVISSSGANIAGIANITGNIAGGSNLSVTSNIVAGNINSVSGILSVTGNANVGNLGTAGLVNATGNITGGNLVTAGLVNATGNITGGNLNTGGRLSVTGNANVGNLGTAGNITAGYYFGDGSQLTNITVAAGSSIINGTSNVVVYNGGNVTTSVASTANVLVVTSTGANIAGTLNATGNANVGNIGAVRAVFTGNISGGNLSVTGNANAADGAFTGNIVARRIGNVGGVLFSLPLTDGSSGQVLSTDGTGNLLWTNNGAGASPFSLVNGTSNLIVNSSGNITMSVAGTSNVVVVSSSGATISGTANITGNANVGNIGAAAAVLSGSLSGVTTISASGNANVGNLGAAAGVFTTLSSTGNAFLSTSTGNVGVGTSLPTYKLHVVNNIDIPVTHIHMSKNNGGSADGVYILDDRGFGGVNSGKTFRVVTRNDSVDDTGAIASFETTGGSTNTVLRVGIDGFVGIGNSAPSHTLRVEGTLSSSGNANVGNMGTAGLIVASGNITGGNLNTGGTLSVTGNANVGNLGASIGLFTSTVTATTFSGSGASLTSLPAGNLTGTIPSGVLANSSLFVGTTSIALNRGSANQALTGILSLAMPGSSSGTITLQPAAAAGTNTITLPAVTGTVVTTGDSGTVTSAMIADGTIVNGDISASAAIAYSKLSLSGSIVNADISASAAIAYSKLSLSGSIVNADISASAAIAVSKLAASTISGVTLGNNLNGLTAGSYLTWSLGTTYNGSAASTLAVDATSANTASKVVARDASGNFSAGTITATGVISTGTIKGSGTSYRIVLPVGTNYYAV